MSEQKEFSAEESKDKMEVLREQGVVYFDVELTEQERESIQEILIENEPEELRYYGPVNKELIQRLHNYLDGIGKNSEKIVQDISKLIARTMQDLNESFHGEHCWVNIRISLPKNSYEVPRWHRDGHYLKTTEGKLTPEAGNWESEKKDYKLVLTLKGPSTRFATAHDDREFNRVYDEYKGFDWNSEEGLNTRRKLANMVEELPSPNNEQAVIYQAGNKTAAKIHSEPETKVSDGPRIFVQGFVGSAEQIAEFKSRWEADSEKQ